MRLVIQRVKEASVSISGGVKSAIGVGLLVLVGIENEDADDDANWLASKVIQMRIFNDDNDVMNRSLQDIGGDLLIISQFTLHARTKKGNRPSYISAAGPEKAIPLYEHFIHQLEQLLGKKVGTGEFGANMQVALINDGPVTILMDSKRRE